MQVEAHLYTGCWKPTDAVLPIDGQASPEHMCRTHASDVVSKVAITAAADLVMLSGSNVAEQIASRLQAAQQTLLQLQGMQHGR